MSNAFENILDSTETTYDPMQIPFFRVSIQSASTNIAFRYNSTKLKRSSPEIPELDLHPTNWFSRYYKKKKEQRFFKTTSTTHLE